MVKFNYKYSEQTQMLDLLDAFLSCDFAKSRNKILELGTYLGGFVLTLGRNVNSINVFCVDPYPKLDHIRKKFIESAEQVFLGGSNYKLYSSSHEIEFENYFNLIHIDGEHSERAVFTDLLNIDKLASESDDAIIIIDDIFMRHYPGVTSATFDFIKKGHWSPFLFTRKKIYLCRPINHANMLNYASELLSLYKVKYFTDQALEENFNGNYRQSNKIYGSSLIIVSDNFKEQSLAKILGIRRPLSFFLFMKLITPPVFLKVFKSIYFKFIELRRY